MKVRNDNIIFFLGGAAIGALGGFFGAKKFYEAKYKKYSDETIAEMREVLIKDLRHAYYVPPAEEEYDGDKEVVFSDEENIEVWDAEGVRRRLEMNHEATNYAAIYGKIHSTSIDKDGKMSVRIVDSSLEEETGDESEEDKEEYVDPLPDNEYAASRKKRKPRLISAAKAHDLPEEVEIQTLYFYTEDEVIADEDTEERIDDYPLILGDCLEKYSFAESGERMIYVMNEELDTCYTVVKINGSYEDTH